MRRWFIVVNAVLVSSPQCRHTHAEMGLPEHVHRAVCNGGLVVAVKDVVEVDSESAMSMKFLVTE